MAGLFSAGGLGRRRGEIMISASLFWSILKGFRPFNLLTSLRRPHQEPPRSHHNWIQWCASKERRSVLEFKVFVPAKSWGIFRITYSVIWDLLIMSVSVALLDFRSHFQCWPQISLICATIQRGYLIGLTWWKFKRALTLLPSSIKNFLIPTLILHTILRIWRFWR